MLKHHGIVSVTSSAYMKAVIKWKGFRCLLNLHNVLKATVNPTKSNFNFKFNTAQLLKLLFIVFNEVKTSNNIHKFTIRLGSNFSVFPGGD